MMKPKNIKDHIHPGMTREFTKLESLGQLPNSHPLNYHKPVIGKFSYKDHNISRLP